MPRIEERYDLMTPIRTVNRDLVTPEHRSVITAFVPMCSLLTKNELQEFIGRFQPNTSPCRLRNLAG